MTLNALNGSIIEVACVRITLLKIVKPTPFRVDPIFINMTVRNSYQIVKVFNSLCVSAPLREIELAKAQSRKEKNGLSLKIVEN
jgi:hypothetical protein